MGIPRDFLISAMEDRKGLKNSHECPTVADGIIIPTLKEIRSCLVHQKANIFCFGATIKSLVVSLDHKILTLK